MSIIYFLLVFVRICVYFYIIQPALLNFFFIIIISIALQQKCNYNNKLNYLSLREYMYVPFLLFF